MDPASQNRHTPKVGATFDPCIYSSSTNMRVKTGYRDNSEECKKEEGILAGMSSGSTFAVELAKTLDLD
jgi:hypothetical protein